MTEDKISQKCFELIFAFDEVITTGGYREPITLQQIRTNLEMESHEEKLHNMIKISKMETARDMAKDAAKNIRAKQAEDARLGRNSAMSGISGGEPTPICKLNYVILRKLDLTLVVNYSLAVQDNRAPPSPYTSPVARSSAPAKAPVKGMSLSSKGAKNKSLEVNILFIFKSIFKLYIFFVGCFV